MTADLGDSHRRNPPSARRTTVQEELPAGLDVNCPARTGFSPPKQSQARISSTRSQHIIGTSFRGLAMSAKRMIYLHGHDDQSTSYALHSWWYEIARSPACGTASTCANDGGQTSITAEQPPVIIHHEEARYVYVQVPKQDRLPRPTPMTVDEPDDKEGSARRSSWSRRRTGSASAHRR